MVGWSHELLTPKEKLVFAQLAVFGGSFDRDAVAAICDAGLAGVETVDVLASLVSKSLVARRDDGSLHARFRLLRLVRQYARAQLDLRDKTEDCGAACGVLLPWSNRPRPTSRRMINRPGWPPSTGSWATSASHRLVGRDQPELAYRIVAALGRWCYLHGRYSDGRIWAANALQAWPDAPGTCARRCCSCGDAGVLAVRLRGGDHRAGARALRQPTVTSRDVLVHLPARLDRPRARY